MQEKHLPKSNIPNSKTKKPKLLALRTERNVLSLIKSIYEKPTAYSMKNLQQTSYLMMKD